VSETLQLEEPVRLYDAPKLLVEWSSPWDEFVTSIRPAMARSGARLAGETPFGLIPFRIMLTAWAILSFLIFVAIVVPVKIALLRPQAVPRIPSHDIIYYSGDELPRTEDLGGAQAGTSGASGGQEAHHRTQTIKVARGHSLMEKVVDAPNLKLQSSRDAVANLLAIKPNPGPPPTEGLRTSRNLPTLTTTLVAPAPEMLRDSTRSRTSLNAVIAPAPDVSRDSSRSIPSLNSNVIAPAPQVSRDRLIAPTLNTRIVAPAPEISHDRSRSPQTLSTNVIAPAPGAVSHDVSRSPVQMANSAVIPPPVSAPERDTGRNAKLSMPAASVIAPPPSADMSRDLRRLADGSAADPSKTIVPPPPTPSNGGSFMGGLIGKIFGPAQVVPPPSTATNNGESRTTALNQAVVPPPSAVTGNGSGGSRGGASLNTNVVPPPPSTSAANRSGNGGASGSGRETSTLLANNVIPPPPSMANSGVTSGQGNRGTGLGAPLDVGSAVAPPTAGGSGGSTAAVVSTQPGSKVGLPNNGGAGSLAISPGGTDKPGLGGYGGGAGISHGKDSGSGMTGNSSGAGKTGTGRGSDVNSRDGISTTPGHGGAGNGTSGTPAAPGVSVAGGSSIVTVTIGSDVGSNNPNLPGRSSVHERQDLRVSIQSTSSSGGAFDFYHLLPGATHTFYIETSPLPAVMTYSDPVITAANRPYAGALTDPSPIHTALPAGLPRVPLAIYCTVDATGNLKNLRVIQAGSPDMTAKIMAALPGWKFSPAMIGSQPVEINAILGFNIDTNDR
jgi:hypothetical protein